MIADDFCGVYLLTNKVNGKVYVGSSVRVKRRIYQHVWAIKRGKHHSKALQTAADKHGIDSFEVRPLIVCDPDNRLMYEQRIMDGYKSNDSRYGYNMTKYAHAPSPAMLTDAQRASMSRQMRERARKHLYNGEMLCLYEIAERAGIPKKTLTSRVDAGMSAQQAADKPLRRSKVLEVCIGGEVKPIAQWRTHYGVSSSTVSSRLKIGWTIEDALKTPVEQQSRLVTRDGLTLSLSSWAKRCGIPQSTLHNRLNLLGWSLDKALTTPTHQKTP